MTKLNRRLHTGSYLIFICLVPDILHKATPENNLVVPYKNWPDKGVITKVMVAAMTVVSNVRTTSKEMG